MYINYYVSRRKLNEWYINVTFEYKTCKFNVYSWPDFKLQTLLFNLKSYKTWYYSLIKNNSDINCQYLSNGFTSVVVEQNIKEIIVNINSAMVTMMIKYNLREA